MVLGVGFVLLDHQLKPHAWGLLAAGAPTFILWQRGCVGGGVLKWFAALGWVVGLRTTILLWPIALSGALVVLARYRFEKKAVEIPGAPVLVLALVLATAIERRWSFWGWASPW